MSREDGNVELDTESDSKPEPIFSVAPSHGTATSIVTRYEQRLVIKRIFNAITFILSASFIFLIYKKTDGDMFLGLPLMDLIYIVLGASLLEVVLLLILWRCPNCNAYLGKADREPSCKKCGVKFTEHVT